MFSVYAFMLNTFLRFDVSRQEMLKLQFRIWHLANRWAVVDVQAPHAIYALYIHTTMSATVPFKTLVTTNQTAQWQILSKNPFLLRTTKTVRVILWVQLFLVFMILRQTDTVSEHSSEF